LPEQVRRPSKSGITSWQAQQLERLQQAQQRQLVWHQQQERLEQQVQRQQQVLVQQRGLVQQAQGLLLFYRKRPKQQQRSRRPK
jgi:hypothetical protein